jgi:hypothetical protein
LFGEEFPLTLLLLIYCKIKKPTQTNSVAMAEDRMGPSYVTKEIHNCKQGPNCLQIFPRAEQRQKTSTCFLQPIDARSEWKKEKVR